MPLSFVWLAGSRRLLVSALPQPLKLDSRRLGTLLLHPDGQRVGISTLLFLTCAPETDALLSSNHAGGLFTRASLKFFEFLLGLVVACSKLWCSRVPGRGLAGGSCAALPAVPQKICGAISVMRQRPADTEALSICGASPSTSELRIYAGAVLRSVFSKNL